jgi:hypothetical protein
VSGGNLFAETKGNGVWRRPLSEMGVINDEPQQWIKNQVNFIIHSQSHFSHSVSIEFSLPHSDRVAVKIYNSSGREIATLVNKHFGSGAHRLTLDTRNIAAGCYFVRMQTGSNTYVRSIPIMR